MTRELQSTLEASGIELPALRNHIPCMAHSIQLAVGTFMSTLDVKDHTKSWEVHERHQQFGENESIDIGKNQRFRKEGNARINKVSAMRPGSKDNWDSTYLMIFWKSLRWPPYSRECLLYWLCWHLVVETSSLTVKMPKSALRYFRLWMWRHVGSLHRSCWSTHTNYGNSHASGFQIQ